MDKLKDILNDLDKPLTKEQLEKIIYNIFCIVIFITPVFSDIKGVGIYSLKSTIFNIATIITASSLLFINRKNVKNIKVNFYEVLLIIYLLLVALSTMFTKHGVLECLTGENGRGEGLITIFSYVITFIIFSKGYKHMIKVSKIAIIVAMIVTIYCILQANLPSGVKIPLLPKCKSGIARGTMTNQNFLSSYICIFLPMTCFYFINGVTKRKRAIIVAVMLFLSLVYSTTLGGYITFAAMYVTILIFSLIFALNKKQTIIRIGILTLILLVAFYIANYEGEDKYITEVSKSKQEVTNLVNKDKRFGSGRLEVWTKSIASIKNNPLFGTGPDSMEKELQMTKYITNGEQDILKTHKVDKAHSEPLHIAVTTGVPSAIIYIVLAAAIGVELLAMVIKTTKKNGIANKEVQYITMVLICFASYLMQSLINVSVIQVAPIYWAILGTAAGIIQNNKISTL